MDAIGIAGTLLTTIGFFQSNWATSAPEGATVNIKGISFLRGLICNGELSLTDILKAGLPPLDSEGDSLVCSHQCHKSIRKY